MKKFIIYLVSVLMVFSNTAFAATKPKIKVGELEQFVKEAKLNGRTTSARTLYEIMKPGLNEHQRQQWNMALIELMDNKKVPAVRLSWLDDGQGNAQNIKFYINEGKESVVIELSEKPEVAYRINGIEITHGDLASDGGRAKLVAAAPPEDRVMTHVGLKYQGKLLPAYWLRLGKKEPLVRYFNSLRALNSSLERVTNGPNKNIVQNRTESESTFAGYLMRCLMSNAHASATPAELMGQDCAFAGWAGVYQKVQSRTTCTFQTTDREALGACGNAATACNPIIFGRNTPGGGVNYLGDGRLICAAKTQNRYNDATKQCHQSSPVAELVDHMKAEAAGDNDKAQSLISEYNDYLAEKIERCESSPASKMADQAEACAALRERMVAFELEKRRVLESIPPMGPVPVEELELMGKVGQKSFLERNKWVLLGLGLAGVGAYFWWRSSKKKKKKHDKGDPIVPIERVEPIEPVVPIVPPTIPKVDRVEVDTGPTIDPNDRPTRYNQLREETVQ